MYSERGKIIYDKFNWESQFEITKMSAIWNDQIGQTNYLVSIHFLYSALCTRQFQMRLNDHKKLMKYCKYPEALLSDIWKLANSLPF